MVTKSATAVSTVPTALSADQLTALLQSQGYLTKATSDFRRMRLDGGVLITQDAQGETEDMYPPKIVKGVPQPSVTVRIVEPPKYFNAIWLGPEVDDKGEPTRAFDPSRIGRPELTKSFSKKYDDPADQAKDSNPANEVYDQIVAQTGKRGDFKADIRLQVLPEDGEFKGDEPVFTLTLPASSALDWRGARRNPTAGTVQEKNFIVQLAEFAVAQAVEAGADEAGQAQAVVNAFEALRLGGVVADIYLIRDTNADKSFTWTVIAFKPVHVELPETPRALPADAAVDGNEDVPF